MVVYLPPEVARGAYFHGRGVTLPPSVFQANTAVTSSEHVL